MTAATILLLVQILAALVTSEYALAELIVLAKKEGGIDGLAHDLIADLQGHATPDKLAALKLKHPDLHAQVQPYLQPLPDPKEPQP